MEYIFPLFSIVFINMLLSGDNALLIALASRRLPPEQQKTAILWGGAGAIGLRLVFVFVAARLLKLPYLQLLGGFLLLWIAIKLISGDRDEVKSVEASHDLWGAVKTIILADVVMSLDNVIAIAGVARGNYFLLALGLAISIPVIIWGSRLILHLMERWPVIITLGGAFLGYVGGEMAVADDKMLPILEAYPILNYGMPALFALLVLIVNFMMQKRSKQPLR
ncbi:MAG: TerC family protein [Negativicutes bacterium]|nr:TerC family protein [Negativicutes bacterium]